MHHRRPLSTVAVVTIAIGLAAVSATTQDPLPGAAQAEAEAEAEAAAPAPSTTTTVPAPTTTTTEPAPTSFTLSSVEVLTVGGSDELPDETRTQVQALLDRYLTNAVVLPLRSGQPAGDLSSIFGGAALERMSGPDRAALVDEGLPATQRLKVTTASADLIALVGRAGVELMTAGITVVVTGTIDGATLTVERSGELLLNADGEDWRVTGYSVRVSRESDEPVTATTVFR